MSESDALARKLSAAEERLVKLERENAALKSEVGSLDPSGKALERAREVAGSGDGSAASMVGEMNRAIGMAMQDLMRQQSMQQERLEALVKGKELPAMDPSVGEGIQELIRSSSAGSQPSLGQGDKASDPSKRGAAGAPQGEEKMERLMAGDLIYLRREDPNCRGTVLGDMSSRRIAIQPDERGTEFSAPLRFSDGLFRLCSRMNYRSRVEVTRINKAIAQSDRPEETREELNLDLAKKRMATEALQNDELLERLKRAGTDNPQDSIHYGDIVQLQHVNSGLFAAMHKTPAPQKPNCRKVSLKKGSLAAQFIIKPRFKVRSIGSVVYADDQILLQSVKHESLYLGASDPLDDGYDASGRPSSPTGGLSKRGSFSAIKDDEEANLPPVDSDNLPGGPGFDPAAIKLASDRPCAARPALNLRLPSALRREATGEVNGSMALRCFTVKMYGRTRARGALLTGLHAFRLFHPEENGYVSASANPDKGVVLDSLGLSGEDPLQLDRLGGTPAHVPYLKELPHTGDSSNPIHLTAKAVWRFETVDRARCEEVRWKSMAVRIRHLASGKYLSVNSARALPKIAPSRPATAAQGQSDSAGEASGDEPSLYDCALVADVDPVAAEGDFGSKQSIEFFLAATEGLSPGQDALRDGSTSLRIEHHTPRGEVLHLILPHLPKPPILRLPSGSPAARAQPNGQAAPAKPSMAIDRAPGMRICFSSKKSDLDVLRVQPVAESELLRLNTLIAHIPHFKKYSYAWLAAADPSNPTPLPVGLCEQLASQCLDLLDDLRKGDPAPRRHGGSITEAMKEANLLKPAQFTLLFGGEPNPQVQKMAHEIKLLDAIFESALAPYNYAAYCTPDGRPFATPLGKDLPRALQKFLYVCVQRAVFSNLGAQEYFALGKSRVWAPDNSQPPTPSAGEGKKGNLFVQPADQVVRSVDLWRNIIISQGEDALGATVTLGQLLKSSEAIVKKLVNNELLDRFKGLIVKMGPEIRLITLFNSICFVENRPSRANQEMSLRKLWMNPPDRYAFGLTLHEAGDLPASQRPQFGPMFTTTGQPIQTTGRTRAKGGPAAYLGKTAENVYEPVLIAWTGNDSWHGNCGGLWWSAKSMDIPLVKTTTIEGVDVNMVAIESLMWVLDPGRLCKPVTGRAFLPFTDGKRKQTSRAARLTALTADSAEEKREGARKAKFDRQVVLASYTVAQLDLLTQMCKGRSYNCIHWLEKSFSYDLLLNMATNPLLPYKCIAAAMSLVQVLYVDRFPQTPNSGTPCLPEKLWVLDEAPYEGPRRSSAAIVRKRRVDDPDAFPAFFLPKLSSAFGGPNPIASHPDHFKFFLLRSFCNNLVKDFNKRLIHHEEEFNNLGLAAIRGQMNLLDFGFQSTYTKLLEMCGPNGALLDGRSDLDFSGQLFDPPTQRYKRIGGTMTALVARTKKEAIDVFVAVTDLRTNFRLAQMLQIFKEREAHWAEDSYSAANALGALSLDAAADCSGLAAKSAAYVMQATPESVDELYRDFEAMFPGGSGDGAKLDIAALCGKPDMDEALIDCMMYEDDDLMASALHLLESNYGQRRRLRVGLQNATLLESTRLPVYGDIHGLRADLQELVYLGRTSTVWGVKSRVSGPFDDKSFGAIMSRLDRILEFLHTPWGAPFAGAAKPPVQAADGSLHPAPPDASCFQGHFAETDLQGNSYECKSLWSYDVAAKWSKTMRDLDSPRKIEPKHQDILRSCDFQEVCSEALFIDNEIAFKGSICTEREKGESERRIRLVKRALLCCTTAFVHGNGSNQEVLFKDLPVLEKLCTPPELDHEFHLKPYTVGATIPKEESIDPAAAAAAALEAWPTSIPELAQNLVLSLLRGNEKLCLQTWPGLIKLFAHVADISPDPSTSPALDLLLIYTMPEAAPNLDNQKVVTNILLSADRGQGLENLFKNIVDCLAAAAERGQGDAAGGGGGGFLGAVADPARVVSLLKACVVGGNEVTCGQLNMSANVNIDATCEALTKYLEAVKQATPAEDLVTFSKKQTLKPSTVLELLSTEGGCGAALLSLLTEQVFLLPLNTDQMTSQHLWGCLDAAFVPAMEALGSCPSMSDAESAACEDVIDCLERLYFTLVRLGLFEGAVENPVKERILSEISEDVETLLSKRQKPPEFLRSAFENEIEFFGSDSLDCNQFGELIAKLTMVEADSAGDLPPAGSNGFLEKLSTERQTELKQSFVDADTDGSNSVDIYEFVALYEKVKVKAKDGGQNIELDASDIFHHEGHKLALRTVENGERIVTIRRGRGSALPAPRYHRDDQFSQRKKKQGEVGATKLFARERPGSSRAATAGGSSGSSGGGGGGGARGGKAANPKIPPLIRSTASGGLYEASGVYSVQKKFKAFKAAVQNNPKILGALQRRRFTMVGILERGVPGPPPAVGRALSANPKPVEKKKKKKTPAVVAEKPPLKSKAKIHPQKSGSIKIKEPSIQDEKAAAIQGAFRKKMARKEMAEKRAKKAYSRDIGGANPNLLCSAVALSWEAITLRLVRYVKDHFWEPGHGSDTCKLIFETWMAHLVKARTYPLDADGNKLPLNEIPKAHSIKLVSPSDLTDLERAAYHRRQTELSRMGVVELLAKVIGALASDTTDGALPDVAVEVFVEFLNGGNGEVQKVLYQYLTDVDLDGQFLRHLSLRLERSFEGLYEAKKNGRIGTGDEDKASLIAHDCESAVTTARLLQLLTEGHNRDFQEYVRHQPMYAVQVDLVKKCSEMLVLVCDSSFVVSKFTFVEIDLAHQLLETLIEFMLGPCAGNQDHIAKSDVIAAINLIVHAENWRDEALALDEPSYMGIRGLSCALLAACLEGREDDMCQMQLERRLELMALHEYRKDLEQAVRGILKAAKQSNRLPTQDEVEQIKVSQAILVSIMTVVTELDKIKMGRPKSLIGGDDDDQPSGEDLVEAAEGDRLVGLVEIAWRGKIERTCFPLPFQITYLTDKTKNLFLDEVDLSTSEKRMKGLIKCADRFISEMELIYTKAEQSRVYRVLHEKLPTFQLLIYALVMLLNLNVLLTPASVFTGPDPIDSRDRRRFLLPKKKAGGNDDGGGSGDDGMTPAVVEISLFEAFIYDLDGDDVLSLSERTSLYITTVLAILVVVGYIVIITNMAVTEVPLLVQEIDQGISEAREEEDALAAEASAKSGGGESGAGDEGGGEEAEEEDEEEEGRETYMWMSVVYGLVATLLFCALHYINFEVNMVLYAFVLLGVNAPAALVAARAFIGEAPQTAKERRFAIVYDCVFCKAFLRNHIVLIACAVLGFFWNTEWFTIQLLDIIFINDVIADIIKSVTSPGLALGLVFYLFCVSVIIYASFGMTHFHDALQVPWYDYTTGEEGKSVCTNMVTCFYFVFYQGLSDGGNMKGFLTPPELGKWNYPGRILFDSIFFVWVGIVLMNIITGLMVDTFSSIREEKESRADTMENDCFVCGMSRNTYEDFSLPTHCPNFDDHLEVDHHIWNYVYYIAFLNSKDETEDSGIESYVRSCIANNSLEWIPSRTSHVLEMHGKTGAGLTDDDAGLREIASKVDDVLAAVSAGK